MSMVLAPNKLPVDLSGEQQSRFLRTINKRGILLEEKAYSILFNAGPCDYISRNQIAKLGEEVREIDIIFKRTIAGLQQWFIVECKRTEYSWIFPINTERGAAFNVLISRPEMLRNNFEIVSYNLKLPTTWGDLAALFDGTTFITSNTSKKDDLAQTSHKDVQDHIQQVLSQLAAYAHITPRPHARVALMPVIVTNAPLYVVEYADKDLDSSGDLTQYSALSSTEWLIFNAPVQNLSAGNNTTPILSIAIVNVNHLKRFMDQLRTNVPGLDY